VSSRTSRRAAAVVIAVVVLGVGLGIAILRVIHRNSSTTPPGPTTQPCSQPTLSTPSSPTSTAGPGSISGRSWIMSSRVLNEMVASPAAGAAVASDTLYVLVSSSHALVARTNSLHIVKTAYFTSEATLADAVQGGTLPQGTTALLYDNENWSLTPQAERTDPVRYYQLACNVAHAHGLLLIATPVPSKLSPRIAPFADVLDIQAQEVQASSSEYSGHVLPLAAAVLSANPRVVVLSGLSTNPRAGIPSPGQLVDDAHSVSSAVKGYWLNTPPTPASCASADNAASDARCSGPQPAIGEDFLAALGQAN